MIECHDLTKNTALFQNALISMSILNGKRRDYRITGEG